MKTLVLCRHAKSDWPPGVSDIQRPLKTRGVNDATRLGQLLASHDFSPDLIITSPANRASSTAHIIAQELEYPTDKIQTVSEIYHEGVPSLLECVRNLPPSVGTAMIFGHNPTMEMAVTQLLGAKAEFEMPTCGMACFESWVDAWQHFDPSNLNLRWYLIPRMQRKKSS